MLITPAARTSAHTNTGSIARSRALISLCSSDGRRVRRRRYRSRRRPADTPAFGNRGASSRRGKSVVVVEATGVAACVEIEFTAHSVHRRLLDGVAMPVPHRPDRGDRVVAGNGEGIVHPTHWLISTQVVGGRARRARLEGLEFAAGAEAVHGAAGEVLDLLKRAKVDVETRAWPATYWLGRERRHFDADGAPAELQAAHDAFDAIEDDHAADESLLQYFVRKGVRSRCLDVADAVYANDYGESASELGAAEVAHEQKHWTGGEAYFVLRNGTLADAAAELARGLDVRLGWPVARVYRDAAGASVRSRRDEMLRARCCVVAAPLGVLKQGAPAFSPALPPAHAEAIRRLPVANALKVAVALDRPVWPRGWWNAVCGDALFPEVWRSGERVVVGFATGARADAVAALGVAPAAARGLLDQLDAMFGARRAALRRHGDGRLGRRAVSSTAATTYPSPGCLVAVGAAVAAPTRRSGWLLRARWSACTVRASTRASRRRSRTASARRPWRWIGRRRRPILAAPPFRPAARRRDRRRTRRPTRGHSIARWRRVDAVILLEGALFRPIQACDRGFCNCLRPHHWRRFAVLVVLYPGGPEHTTPPCSRVGAARLESNSLLWGDKHLQHAVDRHISVFRACLRLETCFRSRRSDALHRPRAFRWR